MAKKKPYRAKDLVCRLRNGFYIRSISHLGFIGIDEATKQGLRENGCALIRPRRQADGQLDPSFQTLGPHITHVHVFFEPTEWAIREILWRCPKLRVIQLPRHNKNRLPQTCREALTNREVPIAISFRRQLYVRIWDHPDAFYSIRQLVPVPIQKVAVQKRLTKKVKPPPKPLQKCDRKKPEGPPRKGKSFSQVRWFFQHLSSEQKKLFTELIELGYPVAVWLYQTLYLNGREILGWKHLAARYGRPGTAKEVETKATLLVGYLGCQKVILSTDQEAELERLRHKVSWLRKLYTQPTELQAYLAGYHLSIRDLPEKVPFWRLETIVSVLQASSQGKLEELRNEDLTVFRVLRLRSGLENGIYRGRILSFKAVGQVLDIPDPAEIRRLEKKGLEYLGLAV